MELNWINSHKLGTLWSPYKLNLWICQWCFPDVIFRHWQPDNWHIWQPWQHKMTESSERYVQYNIFRISAWRWKIYYIITQGQYRKTMEKQLDSHTSRSLSLLTVQSYAWLWCSICLIFLQQKCTTLVTMADVTLNSHLSFRFTSPVVVSNLPWVYQSASCVVAAAGYV